MVSYKSPAVNHVAVFLLCGVLSYSLLRMHFPKTTPVFKAGASSPTRQPIVSRAIEAAQHELARTKRDTASEEIPYVVFKRLTENVTNGAELVRIYDLLLSHMEVEGREKQELALHVVGRLAREDSRTALQWVAKTPKELHSRLYDFGIRTALDFLTLEEVLDSVDSVPENYLRADSIAKAIADRHGLSRAIKWLQSHSGASDKGGAAVENLVAEKLAADPHLLLTLEAGLSEKVPVGALEDAARRMVHRDPQEALAWLTSVKDNATLYSTLEPVLLGQLAQEDAGLALEQIHSRETPDLVGAIIEGWATKDWKAAYAWARDAPHVETESLASLFALVKPHNASDLAEHLPDILRTDPTSDALLAEAAGHVAFRLFEESPEEASTWVTNLPEGDARHRAIVRLTQEWAASEPASAATWLHSLNDPPDEAAAQLVTQLGDLTEALAWASIIKDENLRLKVSRDAVSEWYVYDSAQIQRIIAEAPLDPETKQLLVSP